MPSAVQKREVAIKGLKAFYDKLFEPQLAMYHRVPRNRIADWRQLDPDSLQWKAQGAEPPQPDEAVQNVMGIGALSSGKSHLEQYLCIISSVFVPDNLGVIVRKRWEELLNHVIRDLYKFADQLTDGNRKAIISDPKKVGGSYEIRVETPWEVPSYIIVKPEPDGPEAALEEHWKGPEYGWIALEEGKDLTKTTWRTLIGRLRRKFYKMFPREPGESPVHYERRVHKQSSYLWWSLMVTNPPYYGHWIDEESKKYEAMEAAGELTRDDVLVIRSKMDDNPYTPDTYKRTQKRLFMDDPVQYAMLIEGKNGVKVEGIGVYRDYFRSDLHADDSVRYHPSLPLLVGMDFGYHRPAAVFLQETSDGQYNVIREWCPTRLEVEDFGKGCLDIIQKEFPRHLEPGAEVYFYGDVAGHQKSDKGDTSIARLAGLGINVIAQRLELSDSLDIVRNCLSKMLGRPMRPRLMINGTKCPVLLQAMAGGYYYPIKHGQRDPRPFKTPENHFDDVCDALRYVMANVIGPYGKSMLSYVGNAFEAEDLVMKGIADE